MQQIKRLFYFGCMMAVLGMNQGFAQSKKVYRKLSDALKRPAQV
jgi:hypothetical protein